MRKFEFIQNKCRISECKKIGHHGSPVATHTKEQIILFGIRKTTRACEDSLKGSKLRNRRVATQYNLARFCNRGRRKEVTELGD